MIWVYTGGRPSNGAKALAEQPGFKRCLTGKGIKLKDVLINWGSSQPIPMAFGDVKILNVSKSVASAANKLKTFEQLAEKVSLVEWTTSQHEAQVWSNAGNVVVVRNKLTGHSGDGIVIVEKEGEVPPAPLYTRYIFKEKEFRVHVVCGHVVDTARKIKDPDREVTNWKVRSHDNGFIFARNGILPDVVRDQLALDTIHGLQLDFGAVDIIQDKHGKYYVLEVNTAPGLEGQTIEHYAEAFRGAAG